MRCSVLLHITKFHTLQPQKYDDCSLLLFGGNGQWRHYLNMNLWALQARDLIEVMFSSRKKQDNVPLLWHLVVIMEYLLMSVLKYHHYFWEFGICPHYELDLFHLWGSGHIYKHLPFFLWGSAHIMSLSPSSFGDLPTSWASPTPPLGI